MTVASVLGQRLGYVSGTVPEEAGATYRQYLKGILSKYQTPSSHVLYDQAKKCEKSIIQDLAAPHSILLAAIDTLFPKSGGNHTKSARHK